MKRRGFTLIELLAVIVILAIIALIATPIVMNTIEKSKKGAAERSAENYIEAVDTMVATHKLETGEMLPDGTYSVDTDGNLTKDSIPYTVEVNGTKPKSGSIVRIENGRVATTSAETSLKYDTYTVAYDATTNKLVATVVSNKLICRSVTNSEYGNVPQGNFVPGDEYVCNLGDGDRTFFVLETSGDNVLLIMDDRFTDDVVPFSMTWCDQDDCDHDTLSPYIEHIQNLWTDVTVSLPSMQQIEDAISMAKDSLWLTISSIWSEGYWTSSSYNDGYRRMAYALETSSDGEVNYGVVSASIPSIEHSICPVITISKSQLQ